MGKHCLMHRLLTPGSMFTASWVCQKRKVTSSLAFRTPGATETSELEETKGCVSLSSEAAVSEACRGLSQGPPGHSCRW